MTAVAIQPFESVIDCDGAICLVQRLGKATKKEQGGPQGSVGECALKRPFMLLGLCGDADGEIVCPLQLTTSQVVVPEAAQHREKLGLFAETLTQVLGAAVRALHFDPRPALRSDERNRKCHLQRELLFRTCSTIRLRLDSLERLREMGNCLDVR